jgi:hypothetical protein
MLALTTLWHNALALVEVHNKEEPSVYCKEGDHSVFNTYTASSLEEPSKGYLSGLSCVSLFSIQHFSYYGQCFNDTKFLFPCLLENSQHL